MKKVIITTMISLLVVVTLFAQTTPPSGNNQKSVTAQYLGALAKVTISYNSPSVKGREGKIWGALVPWGLAANGFGTAKQMPWRMGANENTVFATSHDILVNGKSLKAGKYGLHAIPSENEPWIIIFSNASDAWGSYYYEESEDELRISASPEQSEFHEFLTFDFIERGEESTKLAMKWENLMLPMQIELPGSKDLYVSKMKEELKNSLGFSWQNYLPAINYCVSNNTHLEQALEWSNVAISGNFIGTKNFATLSAKSSVLMAMGKSIEATKLMDEAITLSGANPNQIHAYGRQLISAKQAAKAVEVMQLNYDQQNGAWPTTVGLMRAYSAAGDFDNALKFAKLALEQAPDDLNRNFLLSAIEKLMSKQDIN